MNYIQYISIIISMKVFHLVFSYFNEVIWSNCITDPNEVECAQGEVFNEDECQCGETLHILTYHWSTPIRTYVHEYCVCIFCTNLPSVSSLFCLLLVDFNSTITVVPRLSQFFILPSLNSVLHSIRKHKILQYSLPSTLYHETLYYPSHSVVHKWVKQPRQYCPLLSVKPIHTRLVISPSNHTLVWRAFPYFLLATIFAWDEKVLSIPAQLSRWAGNWE